MGKNILIGGLVLFGLVLISLSNVPSEEIVENKKKNDAKTYEPFVVLELFTSQGCSSCPSADVLLEKTKEDNPENVFALSYHVDYWNYIGWEDPFSKPDYALKQRAYNIKFRNRSNYTPQIVVNGEEHFVGSNAMKMKGAINSYLSKQSNNSVKLTEVKKDGNEISFEYQVNGAIDQKQLRAVLALDKRVTSVKRGENKSRILSNSNIVVDESFFELNSSANGSGQLEIPSLVKINEKLHLVLLLENENHDILGAAKKEIVN